MNGQVYYPQQQQKRNYEPVDSQTYPPATDAAQDAHQLLTVYPYGSATPSSHGASYSMIADLHSHADYGEVVRHLSNLSISAAPPSYAQPYAPVPSNSAYHQARFPQYSDYAQEFAHILNSQQPSYGGSYWEETRDEAVYQLTGQAP